MDIPRRPPADPLAAIRPPVTPDDRLTVRYRLPDGSATDVLGWVVRLDDRTVRVWSRPDVETVVDRAAIILARRVPPAMGGRPPHRYSAAELARAALPGWVADSEPLGAWVLRAGGGFTGRANSCLAVGDPGLPYAEAAAATIDFYRRHHLPPRAQLVAGSDEEQDLRRLGWLDDYVPTTVLVQPLAALLTGRPRDRRVRVDTELSEQWWQAYQRFRSVGAAADSARRILTGPAPVGLASLTGPDGMIIAVGRGQVSAEWLGLSALWTDPGERRRGRATTIMTELGHWAARHGARNVYLQVARENAAALAAYTRLGFVRHHDYLYLVAPQPWAGAATPRPPAPGAGQAQSPANRSTAQPSESGNGSPAAKR